MTTEDRSILTLASRAPDRLIRYGNDELQIADVFESRPAPNGPLVILIHGGFWRPAFDRLHLGPLAEAIAAQGFTVASIEYRRVPGAPDLTTADALLACRQVPRLLGATGDRATVIGHSAGGHLTLLSAITADDPVLSFIALAPVASLKLGESLQLGVDAVSAFLGARAETRPDLDPSELPVSPSAVTIIHGTADQIVPISVSEHFLHAHPTTHLVRVEAQGHFALIDPRTSAWSALLDTIRSYAATPRS